MSNFPCPTFFQGCIRPRIWIDSMALYSRIWIVPAIFYSLIMISLTDHSAHLLFRILGIYNFETYVFWYIPILWQKSVSQLYILIAGSFGSIFTFSCLSFWALMYVEVDKTNILSKRRCTYWISPNWYRVSLLLLGSLSVFFEEN